jgi:creatinine amidohydrolase
MSMLWLADVDRETFWAHQPWTAFGPSAIDDHAIAIMPLFGMADHGMGLPLDAEEVLGSAIVKRAVQQLAASVKVRVLPPVRFVIGPYASCVFAIDPETAHDQLMELSAGVKAAGFHKLVFVNASPWNLEFVDATSRDVRVELGLQTFVVNLNSLGLSFHPTSADRAKAQSAVARRLGETPRPAPRATPTAGVPSDPHFRPGNFKAQTHLPPGPPVDGTFFADQASDRLAELLLEIAARVPVSGGTRRTGLELKRLPPSESGDTGPVFPHGFRSRYLPAMHREDWDRIQDRAKAWVIIPTGSIEQHGPHLPVGVDSILGHAWVAQTVGRFPTGAKVYVAPPITYGKSNEHLGFPGTLSISGKTFRRILLAQAAQLRAAGFRQIAVLNSHGGNSAVLSYTLREIQGSMDLRIGVLGQPYKPELSAVESELGFHAGEWETSLMLAIASDLVQMDKAVSEYPGRRDESGTVRFNDGPAFVSWMTSDISESGVMGDAKAASAEKGQLWLERGAAALAQKLSSLDDLR